MVAAASNGGAEEARQGSVVGFAEIGEKTGDEDSRIGMERKSEGALEYDGVVVEYRAAPRGTGEATGLEVLGGSGEVGEGNDAGQGIAERGERSGEGEGGGGGGGGGGADATNGRGGWRGRGELVLGKEGRSGGGRGEGARGASGAGFWCGGHCGGFGFAHVRSGEGEATFEGGEEGRKEELASACGNKAV